MCLFARSRRERAITLNLSSNAVSSLVIIISVSNFSCDVFRKIHVHYLRWKEFSVRLWFIFYSGGNQRLNAKWWNTDIFLVQSVRKLLVYCNNTRRRRVWRINNNRFQHFRDLYFHLLFVDLGIVISICRFFVCVNFVSTGQLVSFNIKMSA